MMARRGCSLYKKVNQGMFERILRMNRFTSPNHPTRENTFHVFGKSYYMKVEPYLNQGKYFSRIWQKLLHEVELAYIFELRNKKNEFYNSG